MGEHNPCSHCSIKYDDMIYDHYNCCDGCFFFEMGCAEEEFYGRWEDYSLSRMVSECEDCEYHNCEWRSFEKGHRCAY